MEYKSKFKHEHSEVDWGRTPVLRSLIEAKQ